MPKSFIHFLESHVLQSVELANNITVAVTNGMFACYRHGADPFSMFLFVFCLMLLQNVLAFRDLEHKRI